MLQIKIVKYRERKVQDDQSIGSSPGYRADNKQEQYGENDLIDEPPQFWRRLYLTINDIVNCKLGIIEKVLNMLQIKIVKYRERKVQDDQSIGSSPGYRADNKQEQYGENDLIDEPPQRRINVHKQKVARAVSRDTNPLSAEILEEKEEQIKELKENVVILELKVAKLEQLVRLKNNKIEKIIGELE